MNASTFMGLRVYVAPDVPRYVLPDRLRLPCGVDIEWPPGFRDEINAWSLSFLGTVNLLPDGQVLGTPGSVHMNPRTYAKFKSAVGVP